MLKQISQISYEKYSENKELGVEEIYNLIKYKFAGKSRLELLELCERMGISEKAMKLAILEGIKAQSIDSLA